MAAVCIFCFSTSSLHHSLINFLQNMIYVFCTLLRRDLPLPELLYTIYKLLLVVKFYLWLEVELEFTPQGFHGLKVRTSSGAVRHQLIFFLLEESLRSPTRVYHWKYFFFNIYIYIYIYIYQNLNNLKQTVLGIVSKVSISYELKFLVQGLEHSEIKKRIRLLIYYRHIENHVILPKAPLSISGLKIISDFQQFWIS